jgi:hypothetical protein
MSGKRAGKLAVGIAAIAMMFGSLAGGGSAFAQDENVPNSITATAYVCPAGMTADTLAPDECTVTTSGFNILIGSLEGPMEALDLGEAVSDGTSYTWDLGEQQPGTNTKWYIAEEVAIVPDTTYIVTGDVVEALGDGLNGYRFDTSYEAPNPVVSIYNFIPAAEEPIDSTLSIHQRLCGANNYDGGDPYTECHDYLLDYPAEYHVYNADDTYDETASPDLVTGNMDFVIPGTRIFITNGASAWSLQHTGEVYCTDANTGETLTTGHSGMGVGSALVVDYPEGASVVCDWYIFSSDADGVYIGEDAPETPTAEPTGTATATVTPAPTGTTTVTSLPNTGSGAAGGNDAPFWLIAPVALMLGGLFVSLRLRKAGGPLSR